MVLYFSDRITLGNRLSEQLEYLHSKDAIILCLKESSLLTAVALGSNLRAWIYPLLYEIVTHPEDRTKEIGAINADGEFCKHPDITDADLEYITMESAGALEDSKRQAMHLVNQQAIQFGDTLNEHVMNGREVILAGDIVTSPMQIAVAQQLLKSLSPKGIHGVAGNVTADVSDLFHLNTSEAHVLDVLPGIIFDDDHYFEKSDTYSRDEQRALALHIQTYWH